MSDGEYSSTEENYDQIYLIFSKQKKTSWPIKTIADQGEDSGDNNDRDEDDLSPTIFEAGCTEEFSVNNW